MNVVGVSSTDAASTSSSSTASTTTPFDVGRGIKGEGGGEDHLARLANLTQGVGKEDSDSTATSTPTATDASALYPGYVPGYTGWPSYYQQFGQPNLAPAAFGAWPAQWNGAAAMSGWGSAYAQSKKGRQTYQRYQTSVLEQKFLQSSYVSKKQREELRLQTQLTDRQIKIWFQNRRMKAKKEKHRLEEGGEHSTLLPPTKGSLPLPHGSLPALPVGLQHLQQQQGLQPDGSCSSGGGLDDKDKCGVGGGWAHMAPNPLLAHQFWPGAQSHPYHHAMTQYQLGPPNI